jgi:hypothetical protein
MNARLLIVDRDAHYREWLRNHLGVKLASSPSRARNST